jgi:hypothetical protein
MRIAILIAFAAFGVMARAEVVSVQIARETIADKQFSMPVLRTLQALAGADVSEIDGIILNEKGSSARNLFEQTLPFMKGVEWTSVSISIGSFPASDVVEHGGKTKYFSSVVERSAAFSFRSREDKEMMRVVIFYARNEKGEWNILFPVK